MKSSDLKIIACITMLIDHVGAVLFPEWIFLRVIGRVSFPIFAFLIVEGYFHTKDFRKYLLRLGVFALISELPFDLAFYGRWFYWGHQNIFFTLFCGLLMIAIFERFKDTNRYISAFTVIAFMIINTMIQADYVFIGILVIFGFYLYRNKFFNLALWIFMVNMLLVLPNLMASGGDFRSAISLFELGSLIFIGFYNGKKGLSMRYLFYIFYPGHLLALYFIAQMIH